MKTIHSRSRVRSLWRGAFFILIAGICAFSLEAQTPRKALVVTVTKSFRHASIPVAEKVLEQIGRESGLFGVEYARTDEDIARLMTVEALKGFDVIIFANTTGNLPLPDVEGFLGVIRDGKGFVGMHAASDTFRGHKPLHPYIQMLGAEFQSHPPGLQSVQCVIHDREHPACRHFGQTFDVRDEIYLFNGFERANVNLLLSLDKHPQTRAPGEFPVAWWRAHGKGRVFYTSLGHSDEVWQSEAYQKHILGGIRWALGLDKESAEPSKQ